MFTPSPINRRHRKLDGLGLGRALSRSGAATAAVAVLAIAGCSSSHHMAAPPSNSGLSSPGLSSSGLSSSGLSSSVQASTGQSSIAPTMSGVATPVSSPVATSLPSTSSPAAEATPKNLAGFQPASVSFVSAADGFVLGSTPCAASSGCAILAKTADAGHSWSVGGVVPAALTGSAPTVSKVRFADAEDGWAFGPLLWSTHDGGKTWHSIAEAGAVDDVEAAAGKVYALVEACEAESCSGSAKLLRSSVTTDGFAAVPGVALGSTGSITLHGTSAWILTNNAGHAIYDVSANGVSWREVVDPCAGQPDGLTLGGVAPVTTSSVYLLCDGDPGAGSEAKAVLLSTDGGVHGTATLTELPHGGLAGQITAASTSDVAVTARSGASWVYQSVDGGRVWKQPLFQGDGGIGYYDVGFTTSTQGVVIYGQPGQQTPSRLYMYRGLSAGWTPVTF